MKNTDYDYDHSNDDRSASADPQVVLREHPNDGGPVSYMAFSNLSNMWHDLFELLGMLNNKDELPQWVDQSLSEAADRLSKVKRYVYSVKDTSTKAYPRLID